MKKIWALMLTVLLLPCALPAVAAVVVTSPLNGATVATEVTFTASGTTTTCTNGVASMGVYVDNKLEYVVDAATLNTTLNLASGSHKVVVQEWDECGGATNSVLYVTAQDTAAVAVTAPLQGSTMASPAQYAATSTSPCAKGVSAMGVYVNNQLIGVQQGSSLNMPVTLPSGPSKTVVQEWDGCGGTATKEIDVTGTVGATFNNLQAGAGWNQWGELPPLDNICDAPCNNQIAWSMIPHNANVAMDGNSTQFNIWGVTPYADVLWSNKVLGQGSTQGIFDTSHTLLPTLHNFILDTYVYVTDLAATQSSEFDINWYGNGIGMEWGTQCNHLGDQVWDLWDNIDAHWYPTSIPCQFNQGAWNHVVLQVQREADNTLLYQTITVNGTTYDINQTVVPFPVPSQWWGMTINYQMDGDSKMDSNTSYLDETKFTYW